MKRALLATVVLPVTFAAMPAAAACVSILPTISCTGTSTGFTDATSGLSVTVAAGATVTRTNSDAIRVRGTGNTVVNVGTIIGANGTDGVDGGADLTVINVGTISAENKAIDAEEKDGLTVVNTGTITATDKAIRNADGNNASLTNAGLIESQTDEGFESGNNTYILNTATGRIIASDDAVQIGENALIENHGLIESVARGGDETDPQDGIDIDSGTINNYAGAVIRSQDDAAIDYDGSDITSYITNFGTISGTTGVLVEKGLTGDPANTAAQIITNSGLIEGRSGLALDLGAGNDALTLLTGGTLIGGADFGADDDALVVNGSFTTDIAGGSWLDGGTGFDTATFSLFSLSDIVSSLFGPDMSVSLSFLTDTSDFTINLVNWEEFAFKDGTTYSYAQLQGELAAVPVPAAGLMLIGGLAGMFALRRRRA